LTQAARFSPGCLFVAGWWLAKSRFGIFALKNTVWKFLIRKAAFLKPSCKTKIGARKFDNKRLT
jgi:hypothetical protein